jgi:hypothetical protein
MLRGGHSVVSQIVEDKLSQTVGIILAGLSKSENFVDDDPVIGSSTSPLSSSAWSRRWVGRN